MKHKIIVSISECTMSQTLVSSLKTQQWELPQTHTLFNSVKAVLEKLQAMSFKGCRGVSPVLPPLALG